MKISDLNDDTMLRMFASRRSMLFIGPPGCAKTSRVQQFARKMKMGLVTFHLTSIDAPDIRGFLIPTKTDAGPISTFTKSPLAVSVERAGAENGIIFLDEFLQADHLVQKAVGPLLSERVVGDWEVPAGWVVWGASNRTQDKAGTNRMLGHISNRVARVPITSDVAGWCRWANDNGVHPMYVAFAQARPGVVFSEDTPADPSEPFCTPRSFTYACDFHAQGAEGLQLPSDPVTQEVVQGFIGSAATELFSFCKVANELPSFEEIMRSPLTAKLPNQSRLDAQYAAMQLIVHHSSPDTVDTLFQYLERLNKEMQTTAAKQMLDKSGGVLLNSKALPKWVAENRALIISTLAA